MANFQAIRARAATRKGGEAVLAELLGPPPERAALATIPDNRILSTMAERVFSAGFVWSVIEQKWPGFEAAFLGFEPKRLLFEPEEFWEGLAADKRIVRNPQKIRSVRDNAAFVERMADEHGSFGKFLLSWPRDDQVGLMAYLGKHGSRLGGNTGQYFLRWVGWDAFILSKDLVAALRDAGLVIGESPDIQARSRADSGADEQLGDRDGPALPAHLAHPGYVDRREPLAGGVEGLYGRRLKAGRVAIAEGRAAR